MLLMVGWRGEPGKKDEPQHVKQGKVMLPMLEAMDLNYFIIKGDKNEDYETTKKALDYNFEELLSGSFGCLQGCVFKI